MVHDNAPKISEFASLLSGLGHAVFIHLDGSVVGPAREKYIAAVSEVAPQVSFVKEVRCEWGSWSLVQGTLNLVNAVVASGKPFTHVQLLSGADLPTQNISYFGEFLMRNPDSDFIESADISVSRWVVHGPEKERFQYYFPFNWRRQRKLFDIAFAIQGLLDVNRKIPCGIRPRMGSQWWTLRLSTCQKLVEFLGKHPEVCAYFKKVLIPDESFFQSVLPLLVDTREIVPRTLTLYHFSGYGKPHVFYDDHLEMLLEQPFFFARKVSPVAKILQKSFFERAVSGPRPEWQDARAGKISWKFQMESNRAFSFKDPMVGHIGKSKHHAMKNPLQSCVVLVCTDAAARFSIEQKLRQTSGIYCVNSFGLPPYRAYGHTSMPALNSFLANELSIARGLTTCICTTAADFAEVIHGLEGTEGIKKTKKTKETEETEETEEIEGPRTVKARCAVLETSEFTIDQQALQGTVLDLAFEKIIVPLEKGVISLAAPAEVRFSHSATPKFFPVFLQEHAYELIEWIKAPVVVTKGGHLVKLRTNLEEKPSLSE